MHDARPEGFVENRVLTPREVWMEIGLCKKNRRYFFDVSVEYEFSNGVMCRITFDHISREHSRICWMGAEKSLLSAIWSR